MRFLKLGIQGFKSFGSEKVFEFPAEPGFYFLTGRNEIEPDLEGNASGKTTTWDAVCWCLYGKTPRNVKAGDVKNWYSDEKVVVWVELEISGERFRVTRTWSPNSLTLQHGEDLQITKKVTQDELEGIIKLNFDHFLYSVLFSQFREQFFDLKPADKSNLFAQILNLEEWDIYSKRATAKSNQLNSFINDLNCNIAEYNGKLSVLESLDFEQKIREWDKEHSEKVIMAEREVEMLSDSLKTLKEEGVKTVRDLKAIETELEEYQESSDSLQVDLKMAKKEEYDINKEVAEVNGEIAVLQNRIQKLKKHSDKCPTCGQTVDISHIEKEKESIADEILEREASFEDLVEAQKEVKSIIFDIQKEIDELTESFQDKIYRKQTLLATNKINKTEANTAMIKLNRGKDTLEALLDKPNPYIAEKEQNQKKIDSLKQVLDQSGAELLSTQTLLDQVSYWAKAFKNIRLFVISEVLTQLELEVNNCLFRLGLKDWRIEFDVDKETKSGTIKKGFTVNIFSPYNTEPVAYESWSGGETQRLKLAGTLGLSNLILARCGVDSLIEIYDEPSNWLSQKGIDQMLETLDSRSKELSKQVWIIDHRSLDYGGFTGMYCVAKRNTGSHFLTLQ